jgi:glycosyltransferase involved in cell wall biosynthesis
MKKFLYVSDVPYWCIARHGQALADNSKKWDHVTINRYKGDEGYDCVVVGSLPIYYSLVKMRKHLNPKKLFVTLASHRDREFQVMIGTYEAVQVFPNAKGIIINDPRYGLEAKSPQNYSIIYRPDRVNGDIFSLKPYSNNTVNRRLRVGWTGSNLVWGSLKNVMLIERLAKQMKKDLSVVWQRREVEGVKTEEQMKDWYRSLDVYLCVNNVITPNPVPVLEALSCGIPVITTKCGTIWPFIYQFQPDWIVEPTIKSLQKAFNHFLMDDFDFLSWQTHCERLRESMICNDIEEMKQFTKHLEVLL